MALFKKKINEKREGGFIRPKKIQAKEPIAAQSAVDIITEPESQATAESTITSTTVDTQNSLQKQINDGLKRIAELKREIEQLKAQGNEYEVAKKTDEFKIARANMIRPKKKLIDIQYQQLKEHIKFLERTVKELKAQDKLSEAELKLSEITTTREIIRKLMDEKSYILSQEELLLTERADELKKELKSSAIMPEEESEKIKDDIESVEIQKERLKQQKFAIEKTKYEEVAVREFAKPNRRKLDVRDEARRVMRKVVAQDTAMRDFIDNPYERYTEVKTQSGENYLFIRMDDSILCIDQIGSGGFGTIYRVSFDSKGVYLNPLDPNSKFAQQYQESAINTAMKVVEKDPDFDFETSIMEKRGDLIEKGTHGSKQFMRMNLFKGDAWTVIRDTKAPHSNYEVWRTMLRMSKEANDLYYKHHIVHRDIKPDNFLVSSTGQVKINDFGLSAELKKRETYVYDSFCGTPYYMPERQIKNRYGKRKYDARTDGYALAKSFADMLEELGGKYPLTNEQQGLLKKMKSMCKGYPYGCRLKDVDETIRKSFAKELKSKKYEHNINEQLFRKWMSGSLNDQTKIELIDEIREFKCLKRSKLIAVASAVEDFCNNPTYAIVSTSAADLERWVKYMPLAIDYKSLQQNVDDFKSARAMGYITDAMHAQINQIKSLGLPKIQENELKDLIVKRYHDVAYSLAKDQFIKALKSPNKKLYAESVNKAFSMLHVVEKSADASQTDYINAFVKDVFRTASELKSVGRDDVLEIRSRFCEYFDEYGYNTSEIDNDKYISRYKGRGSSYSSSS